mmetsp:Transcript_4739/g.20344  ORF Transcript_4739/g.20344 Transcript_4739/m.20344 type:complete len:83 (+) Transcript_4739:467-715(+)
MVGRISESSGADVEDVDDLPDVPVAVENWGGRIPRPVCSGKIESTNTLCRLKELNINHSEEPRNMADALSRPDCWTNSIPFA